MPGRTLAGAVWLVLLIGSFVIGALGDQQPKRARLLAERRAHESDAPNAELRELLDDPRAAALNYTAAAAILVALC